MIKLPDEIKRDIGFILEQITAAVDCAAGRALYGELLDRIGLIASEIALVALVSADALDGMKETETVLMRGELSLRLRQIAFRCLDIQETEEEREIRSCLDAADRQCGKIAELLGVPKPEVSRDAALAPVGQAPEEQEGPAAALAVLRPDGETDADRLRAEIRALRELLTSLVTEREHLRTVVLPDIEAAYMRELGGLEAELYHTEYRIRILKKRLEEMQARANRDQPIVDEEIEELIRRLTEQMQKAYEDFVRRVNEAKSYTERRQKRNKRPDDRTVSDRHKDPDRDAGEPGTAMPEDEEDEEDEDIERECKRLYRKIVKAMHPDLHPDQDEATKTLFKKAILAYKAQDLRTLREIDALMSGGGADETALLLDELRKEKARLLELIHAARADIRAIKEAYPYTKKWVLEDPERLAREKKRLGEGIVRAAETVKRYEKRIEELREQYG